MNITTHPESTPGTLALRVTALCRSRTRTALVAVGARDRADPRRRTCRGGRRIGARSARRSQGRAHRRARSGPERAPAGRRSPLVPRRPAGFLGPAQGRLHVRAVRRAAAPRISGLPLSWKVEAEIAREGAAIDPAGGPFARDRVLARLDQRPDRLRAHAGAIAAAGFVVAAPGHTSNTQDDVRIDFINEQASCASRTWCSTPQERAVQLQRRATRDPLRQAEHPAEHGRPRPRRHERCSTNCPAGSGPRRRLGGLMGHSRGTVTALAAAGGSARGVIDHSRVTVSALALPAAAAMCWPVRARAAREGDHGDGDRRADRSRRREPGQGDRPGAAGRRHGGRQLAAGGQPARPRRRSRAPTSAWSTSRSPRTAASTRPTARSCSRPRRRSTPTAAGRWRRPRLNLATRARSWTGTRSG